MTKPRVKRIKTAEDKYSGIEGTRKAELFRYIERMHTTCPGTAIVAVVQNAGSTQTDMIASGLDWISNTPSPMTALRR